MVLEFLKYLMDSKHLNDKIKSKAKGITLIQLNMEDLREVELIVPPLEQQKVFVEFANQVNKSKFGYLSLSEINAKKLMADIDQKVTAGDVEGAKDLCRNTRGPVASICYQGLMHISESLDDIERSISGYGTVQAANLEKGCSWIKLFIAMAPSLGFLGTVIGMVMSFDQIQQAGDISPTIVASGMKVALITTIFGIIVALILQVFYNYILSKVEHLTSQMEESAVTLMDIIAKSK